MCVWIQEWKQEREDTLLKVILNLNLLCLMRPINHVVFFGLQNGDPQSTLMMSHITLRCLFKFLSVFSWERHWRGNEMIESFLSGQAQAEAQGADLIDNASGGRIHQGPHPFHAWNRHLCMKVHVACGSGPVARLNRLSDYSGSGHGDKGSPQASFLPTSRQRDETFMRRLFHNDRFNIV